jgi:lactate dehydrogenase-like 2-hydroxyacid dehydrogenase
MPRIAILDDYQNVALELADWSPVTARATVKVFSDHLADGKDIVDRLVGFDVVCVMRERTPLTRGILGGLPQLKLIVSTGPRNASIDVEAAAEHGIEVMHTNYDSSPTIELTWALILANARNLTVEACGYRNFKISRNGGAPPGYRDGNRCRNDHLGLGNVREQALSWKAGTLLGERMRNGPASESVASGGASFVTMVKTADLRDREHSAQTRRMHFPWFRRALL